MTSVTVFQLRVLRALSDGPKSSDTLYPLIFPRGKYVNRIDYGSSKGGPGRRECAVNWHLGKLRLWVFRCGYLDQSGPADGKWRLTAEGRAALKNHHIISTGGL